MPSWFHKVGLKRLIMAVMICTFLPVSSATVACQVACAFQSGASHHKTVAKGVTLSVLSMHEFPAQHVDEHLKHAGPCRLATVPALSAYEASEERGSPTNVWASSPPLRYQSIIWPPPRQRPRA